MATYETDPEKAADDGTLSGITSFSYRAPGSRLEAAGRHDSGRYGHPRCRGDSNGYPGS
jgi:hypothetical protein